MLSKNKNTPSFCVGVTSPARKPHSQLAVASSEYHDAQLKLPLLIPKVRLGGHKDIKRVTISPPIKSQYFENKHSKKLVLQNRRLVVPQSLSELKVMNS